MAPRPRISQVYTPSIVTQLNAGLFLLSVTASATCTSYGLLDKLENPGNSTTGSKTTYSCGANCRIFATAATYTGDLGGITGADSKCMSDALRPADPPEAQWKALLSATERLACTTPNCTGGSAENFNWVLRANTTYRRSNDTTIVGLTDASGIWILNLTNSINPLGGNTWTGNYANWTSSALSDRCNDWSDSGTTNGIYALSESVTATAIAHFHTSCSNLNKLYCVEQ